MTDRVSLHVPGQGQPEPESQQPHRPPGVRACAGALIVLAVALFVGGVLLRRASERTLEWPTVPGVVIDTQIYEGDVDDPGYGAVVRYDYTVDGETYRGDQTYYGVGVHLHTPAEVEEFLAAYPSGADVSVYVDPTDPESAVLRPGKTIDSLGLMALAVILALLGGAGLHMERANYRQKLANRS